MSYEIIVSPYYNNLFKCYENILVLNSEPPGPLKQHVKRINIDNLSAFETNKERNCIYAIKNFDNPCDLLKLNDVSQLLLFFNQNNYSIDYKTTKLVKPQLEYNLLFFFSYN